MFLKGNGNTSIVGDGNTVVRGRNNVTVEPDGVFVDGVRYVPERTCRDDGVGVFRCTACGAFAERGAVMDCCGAIPIRYCPNCGSKVVEA